VLAGVARIGRGYWSALVLAGAAVVLLIAGAPTRAAPAGAGCALVGAALTRALDIATQRRAEAAQVQASGLRTWMKPGGSPMRSSTPADPATGSSSPHWPAPWPCHGLAADPGVAAEHVASVLNAPGLAPQSEQWLRQQIDRLTAELDQ